MSAPGDIAPVARRIMLCEDIVNDPVRPMRYSLDGIVDSIRSPDGFPATPAQRDTATLQGIQPRHPVTELDAILSGIARNPDDDARRLVFSDWIEENGDPVRADLLRVQCAIASAKLPDERRADMIAPREGDKAAAALWQPSAPALAVAAPADSAEAHVISTHAGPVLVGAVELVSPSNKDRPDSREAFVGKCLGYLRRRVGVVVADVVTERRANLHAAIMARLALGTPAVLGSELYASAYRPRIEADEMKVEVRQEPLAIGQSLPTMPLWLGPLCVPLELEAACERPIDELRIGRLEIPGGTDG